MTPEAETQKTRMGCNTSKCDCNFENETVSALKAHLERQYGPLGLHYDSIWKSDANNLSHRGSTLGGIQGPKVVQEKEGPKESLQRKSSVGLLACPDTGTRHASEQHSSLGTTGGFQHRPPICAAAPAHQQSPQVQPQLRPQPPTSSTRRALQRTPPGTPGPWRDRPRAARR